MAAEPNMKRLAGRMILPAPHHDFGSARRRGRRIARQTFSGVAGMSRGVTPKGARAPRMVLMIVGGGRQ